MKVAIIGSRSITSDITPYIPKEMSVLISGGAFGVDSLAEKYANEHRIPKLIIRPEYRKYGIKAPLIRNETIVDVADLVIAIWNGYSRGTKYVIDYAAKTKKPIKVFLIK